jgi:tetratricopeptide (TPR) repeat protein
MYHTFFLSNIRLYPIEAKEMLLPRRLSPVGLGILHLSIGRFLALWTIVLWGPVVPSFAQSAEELDAEARQTYDAGRFEEAAEFAKQLYDLRQKQLGPDAPEVATAALNVGVSLSNAKRYAEAIPYFERACAIAAKDFGAESDRVGYCLFQITEARLGLKDIPDARNSADHALDIFKSQSTPERYAAAMFRAGDMFKNAEEWEAASQYYSLAAGLYDPDHLNNKNYLTTSLSEEGQALYQLKKYSAAIPVLERELELKKGDSNASDPSLISTVYLLADCFKGTGDYDRALTLLNEVTAELRHVRVKGHISTEDVLLQIADLQHSNGGSTEALKTYQEVLQQLAQENGNNTLAQVEQTYLLMAGIYASQHDNPTADETFRIAIAKEQLVSPPIPEEALHAFAEYGFFLLRTGRYPEARSRFDQALQLAEKHFGPNSSETADVLSRLGTELVMQRDLQAAYPILDRARRIYERTEPKSASMATTLKLLASTTEDEAQRTNLMNAALKIEEDLEGDSPNLLTEMASQALRAGNWRQALALAKRALALDPAGAVARDVLAESFEQSGDMESAIRYIRESIKLTERNYGPDSENVAGRHFNLARALLRNKDSNAARGSFLTAASIFDVHIQQLFSNLSPAEQTFLIPGDISSQVSGILSTCTDSTSLAEGYGLMLSWKGILVDSLAREVQFERFAVNDRDRDNVARWKTIRTQLAEWESSRGLIPYDQWKSTNDRLSSEKEKVERALLSAGSEEQSKLHFDLNALRSALSEHEVFVDIYRYEQFSETATVETRYAAILVGRNFGPKPLQLGTANDVEKQILRWRSDIDLPEDLSWRSLAAKIWIPLSASLPLGTRLVSVSSDGDLLRIPWHDFSRLSKESETVEVAEVDSARSLIRGRQHRQSSSRLSPTTSSVGRRSRL